MVGQIYTEAYTFRDSYVRAYSEYWRRWLAERVNTDEELDPGDTALIDEYLKSYAKGAKL